MNVCIALLLILVCASRAICQDDTTRIMDIAPNPESVYNSELPHDLEPLKDSIKLPWNDVPKKLQHRLTHTRRYIGWEENGVYLNRNTGIYMLYITRDTLVINYGLDEYGKVVTYTSFVRKR